MTKPLIKKIKQKEVFFGLLLAPNVIQSLLPRESRFKRIRHYSQRFYASSLPSAVSEEDGISLDKLNPDNSSSTPLPENHIDIFSPSSLPNTPTTNFMDPLSFAYLRDHFLPISGGFLTGSLDFGKTGRITNLANPVDDMDAVNLQTLKRSFSLLCPNDFGCISSCGGNINGILCIKGILKVQGSMNLEGSSISNLRDPISGSDAVSMQYMFNNVLALSGGTMTGSIHMPGTETITGIRDPLFPGDAVNLGYLQKQLDIIGLQGPLSCLNLKGGTMSGDIFMSSSCTIKNLPDPTEGSQAVSLHFLQKNYLSLDGGNLRQSIHMGDHLIRGLSDPLEDTDAVNLRTLSKLLSTFTPLFNENFSSGKNFENGLSIPGEMIYGSINLKNKGILTGLLDPKEETDAVSLKYLQLSLGLVNTSISSVENNVTMLEKNISTLATNFLTIETNIAELDKNLEQSIAGVYETLSKKNSPIQLDNLLINAPLSMEHNRITSLASPENPFDAVNKLHLDTTLTAYSQTFISLSGGTMKGILNMNSHVLTGISTPINPSDAVNLEYLNSRISSIMDNFADNAGNTECFAKHDINMGAVSTGNAIIGGYRIRALANPQEGGDAVNLSSLQASLNNYLPLSGNTMKGHLNMGNYIVQGLADPIDRQDAVNLNTLTSHMNSLSDKIKTEFLPLEGGTLTGNINLGGILLNSMIIHGHNITGLATPSSPTDAVNLLYLSSSLSTLVRKNGEILEGSLNFQNKYTVTGLSDPTNETDAVNLKFFQSIIQPLYEKVSNNLSIKGGQMQGNLDMGGTVSDYDVVGGFSLTGLRNPKQPGDAVNLHHLDTVLQSYLSVLGGVVFGSIDFGRNGTVTGLRNPIGPTDAVNLQTLNNWANGQGFTGDSHALSLDGGIMNGEINMASFNITGLGNPVDLSDAVNLEYLIISLSDLLPHSGGSINGSIIFEDGATIKNLPDPVDLGDAVNLSTLKFYLKDLENCISPLCHSLFKAGGIVGKPLNMNNYRIEELADPTNPYDAVNLHTLETQINALSYRINSSSGSQPFIPGAISQDLNMNNFAITSLRDPASAQDAVNLRTMETKLQEVFGMINDLKKSSPTSPYTNNSTIISGDLSLNSFKITDLADPSNPTDAVNLRSLDTKLNALPAYLPLDGGTLNGFLHMNSHKLTGLISPTASNDAVNLQYLNSRLLSLSATTLGALSLQGGTLRGSLNMNGNSLTGLPLPRDASDAVSFGYLQNCGLLDAFMTRPHHQTQATISNSLLSWKKDGDVLIQSSHASDYFLFSGENNTEISLLQSGCYEINLSFKSSFPTTSFLGTGSLQVVSNNTTYDIGFFDSSTSSVCSVQSSWTIFSFLEIPVSLRLVFDQSISSLSLSGLTWHIKVFRLP